MTVLISTLSLLLLHLLSSNDGTNPGFLVNATPVLRGNITHIVGRTKGTNVWDSSSSSSKHSINDKSLQVSSSLNTIDIVLPPTDQFSNGRIQQHFFTIPPVRETISVDSISEQGIGTMTTQSVITSTDVPSLYLPIDSSTSFQSVPVSLANTITMMTREGPQGEVPSLLDTREVPTTILPISTVMPGEGEENDIVSSTIVDTFTNPYSPSNIEPDYPLQTLTVEMASSSIEYTLTASSTSSLSHSEYLTSTLDVSQAPTMEEETSSYTQSMVTVLESVNSTGSTESTDDTTQTEVPTVITTATLIPSTSFYSSQLVPTSSPQIEILSSTTLQSSH